MQLQKLQCGLTISWYVLHAVKHDKCDLLLIDTEQYKNLQRLHISNFCLKNHNHTYWAAL